MYCTCCVSGPLPEQSQPKKQSLASRLSQKFQASLSSDRETDDDFQPDRKRIRTAEQTVVINAVYILNLMHNNKRVRVNIKVYLPHDIKKTEYHGLI